MSSENKESPTPSRLQRSAHNMAASAVGFVVPMVVTFITTPLLFHALGETAYGLQSLSFVIVGYFAILDLGLDLPIIKFLAEDKARNNVESANRLLSTTLQIYLVVGLIGGGSIFIAADFLVQTIFKLPPDSVNSAVWVFRLAGIGFVFNMFLSWGRAIAVGLQHFGIANGVAGVANTGGTIIGLIVVYAGGGVEGYVLARVPISLLASIAYWLFARRIFPELRLRWGLQKMTLQRIKGFVGYGTLLRVANALFSRLDQVLIGAWVGVAQAGLYALPVTIVTLVVQSNANMVHFVVPMASELQGLKQIDHLRDVFTRTTRFVNALSTMCFIPLLVLGDHFLTLWIGQVASESTAKVFRLLLIAGYVSVLTSVLLVNVLIGLGRMKQFAFYLTIRGITTSLANMLLIPLFGMQGAGLAQLAGSLVDVAFMVICFHHYLRIDLSVIIRTAYAKPVLLGLGMACLAPVVRPFADSWIGLSVSVGFLEIIYVAIGFWIGVFGKTEIQATSAIWQRISPVKFIR